MKTIKEVAETVNVSKTSIYNLIKKHNIPTFKKEGKTFLDESGEKLVIGYYSTEQHETISDILIDSKLETENKTIQLEIKERFKDSNPLGYTKVINILEDERNEKNQIIKDLLQSNKILSQALAADKVNETARLLLKDSIYTANGNIRETNAPRGFFSKFFKKKQTTK